MKDQRLRVFRNALERLIESLDAAIRLSRWSGGEAPPEPLVRSAAAIVDHLGVADRLSSSRFHGNSTEANIVASTCAAMKRLDAAYRSYRQQNELFPERAADTTATLETEISAVLAESAGWG